MGTEVRPPDLELWATGFIRNLLATRNPMAGYPDWDLTEVDVGNKWPAAGAPFPAAAVIVRDDAGPRKSPVSWSRSLAVSVLAGTRLLDAPARDLAFMLFGALADEGLPLLEQPSPLASVDDSSGPYRVAEAQDRTLMYFTVEYTVCGTPVVDEA